MPKYGVQVHVERTSSGYVPMEIEAGSPEEANSILNRKMAEEVDFDDCLVDYFHFDYVEHWIDGRPVSDWFLGPPPDTD